MTINPILRAFSEAELLQFVLDIMAKNGPLSGIDKQELKDINDELQRRDLIKIAKQYHPSLK